MRARRKQVASQCLLQTRRYAEACAAISPPAIAPQSESAATAELGRGTGLMVEGFNRGAARPCSGAGGVTAEKANPDLP